MPGINVDLRESLWIGWESFLLSALLRLARD
jgi:hypothetical protein